MFKISDPNATLLVELNTQRTVKTFAFLPNEERALTVGSDARAELRVTGAGVAPVQFHLERQGGIVCLIPAYGLTDLRVNTARVSGPIPLEERNVIEIGEVRVDATVLDGGKRDAVGGDEAWSPQSARISEPPGEGDATEVAMRAVTSAAAGIGQQTTAVLRPIDAPGMSPQQTERMAPYRADVARPNTAPMPVEGTERMAPVQRATNHPSIGPAFTTEGTEIMAPYRPNLSDDPDSPPPTVRTGRSARATAAPVAHAPRNTPAHEAVDIKQPRLSSLALPIDHGTAPVTTPPIVPVPVVAVTIVAPAKAALTRPDAASPFVDQGPGSNTTLFEVPAVRPERGFADSRTREVTPTAVDLRSPISEQSARDETPSGVAKAKPPTSRAPSWLVKLGLLAKARPVLVACGATAGALLLTTVLCAATRLAQHHELRASQAAKTLPAPRTTPLHTATAAPVAPATPIQIVEAQATLPVTSATRSSPSLPPRKVPNDPELVAAVADLLAGRYSDARAAYAALSRRSGSAATYASLARMLGRAENPECAANGQGAPKDCPGVHR